METATTRKPAISFIFITLVLAIAGFGLLVPVLPKLVVELNGGGLTSGSYMTGWISSIFAVMQFVCSPILGSLSDRFGRRRIILIATAGSAIDYVIMANAPTLSWFFVSRIIAGSTAGVLSTANAYIADVTPPEKRAQAFGLLGAAFGVGFIIGPVAGGFLGNIDLRLPFWFAAACSSLNWLYGFFVLPESLKPENRRAFSWRRANPIGSLMALKRFPAVLGLTESFFFLILAQVMIQQTWALYGEHRYGWLPKDIGYSLGFVGIATGLVQAVLIRKIVPKLGETRSVILGLSISIFSQICYGLAREGWMIYAIICVGAFAGISGPAVQSYITKHVPANEQGSVQGILSGLQSLAGIPGPWIGTHAFGWAIALDPTIHLPWIFSRFDNAATWLALHLLPRHPGISFFLGAALTAVALVLVIRSFRKDAVAAATAAAPIATPTP